MPEKIMPDPQQLLFAYFWGYTPLHRCLALYGSEQTMAMARVLLERGADPNAVTRMGNVPLADAVRNNRIEFVKLLLEFGVS